MPKVSKRGGFSDRYAIKPVNTEIQIKEFDQRTRVQLQNMLSEMYTDVYEGETYYGRPCIQEFFCFVLGTIYSEPIDVRETYHDDEIFSKYIYSTIMHDEYDDVLTLLEAIVQYWDQYLKSNMNYYYHPYQGYLEESVFDEVNTVFKREYVGYRFIDGKITPISDEYEVSSIQEVLKNQYQPVRDHISKANALLADREKPDYENSIKESISAVEAICEIITGMRPAGASLGKMLKQLENNGVEIHGSLKLAFNALYGYTSDANGIRHAGDIGGPASTFEEAKFMLVSCSAFINYLMALQAD